MTRRHVVSIHTIIVGWSLLLLGMLAACTASVPPGDDHLLDRSREAWAGDWHAVWQIEWSGAPVRGPLVAEFWRSGDGRLRIETLEASTAALNGLTLVDDGIQVSLYNLRLNQVTQGAREHVRIPLADDLLVIMDWLLSEEAGATITAAGGDELESGPATRLELTTADGARATLWVDEQSKLPAGLSLDSGSWGDVNSVARSIQYPAHLVDGLFAFQAPPDAEIVVPESSSPQ